MPEEYEEIDLKEIFYLLWDNKKVIIAVFMLAVISAALVSQFVLTESFQSNAVLYAPSFNLLNGESLNNREYTNFFRRTEVLETIIQEFSLRDENPNISYDNLRNKLSIDIDEENNIVRLSLQDSSAEMARDMLQSWYQLAQEQLLDFIDNRNQLYISSLQENMEEYQAEYMNALDNLVAFEEEFNLDLLRSELESKEDKIVENKESIEDIKVAISKDKSEYQVVLEQFEAVDRFINLRVPVSEAVLYLLDNEMLNLDKFLVEREVLNSQYERLETSKNNLEQRLSVQREELLALEAQIPRTSEQIEVLQKEIANQSNRKRLLQQDVDLYRSNFSSAENRYHSNLQQLANADYTISVINQPIEPSNPVSPNKKLNVAIAGVLGLMLAVFFVFFREYMKEDEQTQPNNEKNDTVVESS